MMVKIKVSPGLVLRDPVTKVNIPEDGIMVDDADLFWARRIRDQDVVIVQEAAKKGSKE
jgi:hypothetical protein